MKFQKHIYIKMPCDKGHIEFLGVSAQKPPLAV